MFKKKKIKMKNSRHEITAAIEIFAQIFFLKNNNNLCIKKNNE